MNAQFVTEAGVGRVIKRRKIISFYMLSQEKEGWLVIKVGVNNLS